MEILIMKLFGLKNKKTGELMRVYVSANEGDFCTSIEHRLDTSDYNPLWLVVDRKIAELAAINDTGWYNAGFETPSNAFVGQLEVVEISLEIK
jgi:hypothetical protein